jgi:hypothetical protein
LLFFNIVRLIVEFTAVFQVRALSPEGEGRMGEILLTTPLMAKPHNRKVRKKQKNTNLDFVVAAATTVNYSLLDLDTNKLQMVEKHKMKPLARETAGSASCYVSSIASFTRQILTTLLLPSFFIWISR